MENVYEIVADYRKNNPNKPRYYVYANNKKEAKQRFSDIFTWLTIYNINLCDQKTIQKIISDPMRSPIRF